MSKKVLKQKGKTFAEQFGFHMPLHTITHYKRGKGKKTRAYAYEFP